MATQAQPTPDFIPLPGQTPERYRRNRRSEFAIWWREIDRPLLAMVLVLMAIGAAAVAAASPASARRLSTANVALADLHFFYLNVQWQVIGLCVMLGVAQLPKDMARRLGILITVVSLVGLLLVPLVGTEVNGAKRWLNLGISIQPSSILTAGFPVVMAWILSWRVRDTKLPVIEISLALMCLIAFLIMLQPDFGTTVLFGATWFALILMSGLSLKRVGLFGALGIAGVVSAYLFYDNARYRIDSFLGGGTAFDQVDLARRTLLNGGWTGSGFWLGERKMSLPEAHTDYIFSVIGEEFGLLACAVVVMLFFAIMVRGLLRLMDEEDLFTVLAGTGLICQFSGQAFINILVNLQLFPSKGMTLPLVSYGGSSTVAMCLCIGLLLAITRRNPFLGSERFSFGARGSKS